MPPKKSIFASKTAWVNFIVTGATLIGYFRPATSHWVQSHAALIVSGSGTVNVALRFITKGRVSLFGADS